MLPKTDTLDVSTSSEVSLVGAAVSAFLASHFSFFNLYEGVEIRAHCSGVKAKQNLQFVVSLFSTQGSVPYSSRDNVHSKSADQNSP